MCVSEETRKETDCEKSKRPEPDRLAAIFIPNKINPFSAAHDQCWSRQEITFIRDCGCGVYSHNFLVTWCTTVVDKEVMSCMLHPVCVIGPEWQTSTVLMCAVSSVGEGSLQDVAMESQIRAHIRAGGRQSKYSNGGRGADCLQKKKEQRKQQLSAKVVASITSSCLKKKKKSVQCPKQCDLGAEQKMLEA